MILLCTVRVAVKRSFMSYERTTQAPRLGWGDLEAMTPLSRHNKLQ